MDDEDDDELEKVTRMSVIAIIELITGAETAFKRG